MPSCSKHNYVVTSQYVTESYKTLLIVVNGFIVTSNTFDFQEKSEMQEIVPDLFCHDGTQ